jgi:hypothetical protein
MGFIERRQEWEPEGTGRKGRRKEKLMDGERLSVANHKLIGENVEDRNVCRIRVLGKGKPPYTGQILE